MPFRRQHTFDRFVVGHAVTLVALLTSSLDAASQLDLNNGIFFEAEDYDGRPWYSDEGFGAKTDESLASNDAVLIGMYKPGALIYGIESPAAGEYHVWMRCAVPGNPNVKFGANTRAETELNVVRVEQTTELAKLSDPGVYQWRKLGTIVLKQGENTFVLGQGALRPDCFFLTQDADFVPGDDLLADIQRVKEAPRGQLLPELRHDRQITQHPKWLVQRALRPAYAHCEWDRANTPQSWAKMAHDAGANCLVGVGEMPAGTLNGKMQAFPFQKIDDPNFKYPEGYQKDDLSWVKEFVDAGHDEKLPVVIYDGAFRTLDPLLIEHPEWRQQSVDGRPFGSGFGSWHSPYRQAYIDRWVKVARECHIDGIMVDMIFTGPQGGDYSPWTVKAFRERFGVEPPKQEDYRDLTWQRWIDFQAWTREEAMLDVTEALHAVDPEIACIWNQVNGWIFADTANHFLSTRAAKCADGLLEEMGWEVIHGAFDRRPSAWPLQSAWQSLFLHCRTTPGYGQMWHLNGLYTRVNHQALSYSMFANGIAPAVVTGGNWEFMQQVWDHIARCESHMVSASLVPYAAIHFSENTLHWYANARDDATRNAYLMSVFGLFQALLETHLPVAIVTDDDLDDAARLERYACLILPNSACISDAQAGALKAYVESGGGLIATFESGMYDENGTRREAPALEELLGATQGSIVDGVSWGLRTAQTHEIVCIPEIVNGGESSQGSRDRKPYIQFFRASRNRKAQVIKTTALAGVESIGLTGAGSELSTLHTHAVGNGRVAYFPPDIGHGYFTYNHPIARRLIERTVRWTAQTPLPVETNAPMAVQTVCFNTDDDVIVHLVNDNSSFGRAAAPNPENFGAFRDEVIPVHEVTLTVNGTFKEALLLPDGKTLPITSADGKTQTTVPKIDVHAMVVFSN